MQHYPTSCLAFARVTGGIGKVKFANIAAHKVELLSADAFRMLLVTVVLRNVPYLLMHSQNLGQNVVAVAVAPWDLKRQQVGSNRFGQVQPRVGGIFTHFGERQTYPQRSGPLHIFGCSPRGGMEQEFGACRCPETDKATELNRAIKARRQVPSFHFSWRFLLDVTGVRAK